MRSIFHRAKVSLQILALRLGVTFATLFSVAWDVGIDLGRLATGKNAAPHRSPYQRAADGLDNDFWAAEAVMLEEMNAPRWGRRA